jgi:hypothetical protein
MAEQSNIKKHPGFLAFSGSNVSAGKTENTQAQETAKDVAELKEDNKYADTNNGGEQGKAE